MTDMTMPVSSTQFSRSSQIMHDLLRIVMGLLVAQHGAQKLFGLFGGFGGTPGATASLTSMMGAAGIIEFAGGLLIAIGLFTRPAAFVVAGELAVAYFMAHFPRGFWPIMNGGELAVAYCFTSLFFATSGAGPWSFDAMMRRGRAS